MVELMGFLAADFMKIEATVIEEAGFLPAIYGLGLSYGLTNNIPYKEFIKDKELINRLSNVAVKLSTKDGGHNKFLESIKIYLIVNAPRFWWSEADTYRLSTKQSASTMHTLVKEVKVFSEDIKKFFNNGMSFEYNPLWCAKKAMREEVWDKIRAYVNSNFDINNSPDAEQACVDQVFRMAFEAAYCKDECELLIFCKGNLPESYMQKENGVLIIKRLGILTCKDSIIDCHIGKVSWNRLTISSLIRSLFQETLKRLGELA